MAARVSSPNAEGSVDPEGDLHVVAFQRDALDLADPDAGDPDLVVRLEATGLRERGVVGVPTPISGRSWARKAPRIISAMTARLTAR